MKGDNEKRAKWARSAIKAHMKSRGDRATDIEGAGPSAISDLLTDLRHYAEKQGFDFEELSRISAEQYEEEVNEEENES